MAAWRRIGRAGLSRWKMSEGRMKKYEGGEIVIFENGTIVQIGGKKEPNRILCRVMYADSAMEKVLLKAVKSEMEKRNDQI